MLKDTKVPSRGYYYLGKYHFLPRGGGGGGGGGGLLEFGGTHEFWKSKEGNRRIFGTLRGRGRGGGENFTDPIEKKIKKIKILIYIRIM